MTAPAIAAFAKLLMFQDIAQAPASAPPAWLTELSGRHLLQAGDANGDGAIGASELHVARDSIAIALPLAMKLPYVLTALIAASGMAVALAAAGSHLFTLSASLAEDLYRVIDRRPTALPRLIAAWAAIGASALAACVFLLIADLDPLRAALTAFAFAGSTFFAPLLLAIWWPRCTAQGAFAALGAGFLVIVGGDRDRRLGRRYTPAITTAMASLIGSALGLVAGIAASLLPIAAIGGRDDLLRGDARPRGRSHLRSGAAARGRGGRCFCRRIKPVRRKS